MEFIKKPLQLENCTDHLQCVFLNDYEKNVVCTILNNMKKHSCLITDMEILGDAHENNILIMASPRRTRLQKKIWQNCIDKTCNKDIIENVLKNQQRIMNDIVKVVILSSKYKYLNDSLSNQQFKESLMPILYLRICFKNIGDNLIGCSVNSQMDFWRDNPVRNMFINAVINHEILMSYIHFLRNINKTKEINPYKWKQRRNPFTKEELINYSSDKYFEHYFNEINQRAMDIQKYIPQKLPMHFDYFELNKNICLPHHMLQLELMNLSKNVHKAKNTIHFRLHRKLKKVVTLEEMLRQIFENNGRIPHTMYLNGEYLKYLVETKSINFVTLKLQKMKTKALKDCKSLNMQLKYIKRVESKMFKRYRILSCGSEPGSDDTEKVIQTNNKNNKHELQRCYSDAKLEVKNYCIFNFKYIEPKNFDEPHIFTEPEIENTTQQCTEIQTIELDENSEKPEILYTQSITLIEEPSVSEYLHLSNGDTKEIEKIPEKKIRSKLPTRVMGNNYSTKHKLKPCYYKNIRDRRLWKKDLHFVSKKEQKIVVENSDDGTDIEAFPSEASECKTTPKKKLYLVEQKNSRNKTNITNILNIIKDTFKENYDVSLLDCKEQIESCFRRKSLSKFHHNCGSPSLKNKYYQKTFGNQSRIPIRVNKHQGNDLINDQNCAVKEIPILDKLAKFVCLVEQ